MHIPDSLHFLRCFFFLKHRANTPFLLSVFKKNMQLTFLTIHGPPKLLTGAQTCTYSQAASFNFYTKAERFKSLKTFSELKHNFVDLQTYGKTGGATMIRCVLGQQKRNLSHSISPIIHLPTDIIRVVPPFL